MTSQHSRRRDGFVMVVVLVVLMVMSAVLASSVRIGLTGQERLREEERLIQADWLCESGLERARVQLRQDSKYRGENWTLTAADLGGRDAALVQIQVEPTAEDDSLRLVRVHAVLSPDSERRVTRTLSRQLGPVPQRAEPALEDHENTTPDNRRNADEPAHPEP